MALGQSRIADVIPQRGWPFHFALGMIALLGFALRVLAARNGLWLDEAWSSVYGNMVTPVLGVFASIHHDNNHPLNTLWLQLVGLSAPPLLARLPAILCGTASIIAASAIAVRKNSATRLFLALLFAVSPMLVLLGSEARGYAPMLLCLLIIIWQSNSGGTGAPRWMAIAAAVGTLAHLFMLPALMLVAIAYWLEQWRGSFRDSAHATIRLFGPSLAAAALAAFIYLGPAYLIAGGLILDGYQPFSWDAVEHALGETISLSFGIGDYYGANWLGLIPVAALVALTKQHRYWLPLLFIGAMPLGVSLLHPINSGFSRYYVVITVGLLILSATRAGQLIENDGWRRFLAVSIISFMTIAALIQDRSLIETGRGHVERAVVAIRAHYPHGARVALPNLHNQAVLQVAAAQMSYPLHLNIGNCTPSEMLFLTQHQAASLTDHVHYCGVAWNRAAEQSSIGPSGETWALYAAAK